MEKGTLEPSAALDQSRGPRPGPNSVPPASTQGDAIASNSQSLVDTTTSHATFAPGGPSGTRATLDAIQFTGFHGQQSGGLLGNVVSGCMPQGNVVNQDGEPSGTRVSLDALQFSGFPGQQRGALGSVNKAREPSGAGATSDALQFSGFTGQQSGGLLGDVVSEYILEGNDVDQVGEQSGTRATLDASQFTGFPGQPSHVLLSNTASGYIPQGNDLCHVGQPSNNRATIYGSQSTGFPCQQSGVRLSNVDGRYTLDPRYYHVPFNPQNFALRNSVGRSNQFVYLRGSSRTAHLRSTQSGNSSMPIGNPLASTSESSNQRRNFQQGVEDTGIRIQPSTNVVRVHDQNLLVDGRNHSHFLVPQADISSGGMNNNTSDLIYNNQSRSAGVHATAGHGIGGHSPYFTSMMQNALQWTIYRRTHGGYGVGVDATAGHQFHYDNQAASQHAYWNLSGMEDSSSTPAQTGPYQLHHVQTSSNTGQLSAQQRTPHQIQVPSNSYPILLNPASPTVDPAVQATLIARDYQAPQPVPFIVAPRGQPGSSSRAQRGPVGITVFVPVGQDATGQVTMHHVLAPHPQMNYQQNIANVHAAHLFPRFDSNTPFRRPMLAPSQSIQRQRQQQQRESNAAIHIRSSGLQNTRRHSMLASSQPIQSLQQQQESNVAVHIRSSVSHSGLLREPSPKPLGTRCQLCNRDLAFLPSGSSTRSNQLPVHALLPCGHWYHQSCLENLFGPEPPSQTPYCVACLQDGGSSGPN